MSAVIGMEKKKMAVSAAHRRAIDKYQKEKMTPVFFRVNNNTDKDVLEFLKTIDNKRAYFLALIRKDMADRKASEEQK